MNNFKKILLSESRKSVLIFDAVIILLCFSVYMALHHAIAIPYNIIIISAYVLVPILFMACVGGYDSVEVNVISLVTLAVSYLAGDCIVFAGCLYSGYGGYSMILTMLLSLFGMVVMRVLFNRTLSKEKKKSCLIVGAGICARMLMMELLSDHSFYNPICMVDDDDAKQSTSYYGVRVKGKTEDIVPLCEKYKIDTIIIAMPSVNRGRMDKIIDICAQTHCFLKYIPSVSKYSDNSSEILQSVTAFTMEDLLGREPISVDSSEVQNLICDNVCMVTGGGGSIGAELCRQIMKYGPKLLVIVDIYENNAYEIQQELRLKYGRDCALAVEIASVRDYEKMDVIFGRYKPNLVFHAAAHKHVPLMEYSADEAIKNNVGGTYNCAKLAIKHGAERFLLISTDKAVRPTNVMGASKRCCEMVVKYLSQTTDKTTFVTVRFGNVLGSNGSVVPLFEKQIKNGGPITITHPDITRYFMTIPEAVSLVLQAETMAQNGQIFVLDMGKPVKIVTLAQNLIKLHGMEPDKDIKIEFVGLREGEKLYEELRLDEEEPQPTYNKKIFIGSHIAIKDGFEASLEKLFETANNNDADGVIRLLKELVPTYTPDTRVHKNI